MKTKDIIWLFSLYLNGQELFGEFCREHGFKLQTTGDWIYFDEMYPQSNQVAALVVDADQFDLENLEAIIAKIQVLEKAGAFHGRLVFLSKDKNKSADITRKLHRVCLPPQKSPVAAKLSQTLLPH